MLGTAALYCHGCDHTDVVHVDSGEIAGVKMDGVQWTVVGRGFVDDTSSSWAYVYVDERASDAQVKSAHADFGDETPYIEQVPAKHGHEQ